MAVSTSTFIKDAILVIRTLLRTNVTDPISSSRSAKSKFVHTSYPQSNVQYPHITIRSEGVPAVNKMGMRSELRWTQLPIEIRIWAKNEEQRDSLTQDVINVLRSNEFGSGSTSDTEELHDFTILSSTPVDETGKEGVKSMVVRAQYMFVLGS